MAETGRFLSERLGKEINKKVILVGSFYPIVGFSLTDATYNLGYAIASLEHIKPGVYVAMNSHLFLPNEVSKDIANGMFKNTKD